MHCNIYFDKALVESPFTYVATENMYRQIVREGHLLRDASDDDKKIVTIRYAGLTIDVNILFKSSELDHPIRIRLDPHGMTVREVEDMYERERD